MKKSLLVPFVTLAATASVFAADAPLGVTKNLARQHLGANLFQYNPGTQAYSPTQAAAAWLDDDITTGWPAMMGKQYYLLALPEGETVSSFSLSARPTEGTVSLFVGDEPAVPTAKSWTPVATDVAQDALNDKQNGRAVNRAGKYLLIETNIADPGAIYSLYAYGQKPATSYTIASRSSAIDTRAIYGPYANENASFNVIGPYAQAQANGAEAAVDDVPDTSYTFNAGADVPFKLAQTQTISRFALKADASAKGRFDFFLSDGQTAASLANTKPAASITLDGSNARSSVDLAPTAGSLLTVRWTPTNPADTAAVYELEAFSTQTLAANKVTLQGAPVDETSVAARKRGNGGDGKETNDPKAIASADGKTDNKVETPLSPIAEGGPYLPGSLGFPPNLNSRRFRVPPPTDMIPPPIPPETSP